MTSEALINHLNNRTNCCYAPNDRYCEWGRQLWIDDKVQAVLDEEKIEDRRYLLEQMERNMPTWLDEIKKRVAEKFEQNRRKAA